MIREIQGFKIHLDDKDSLGLKDSDVYDEQETQLINKLVRRDDVVVDIGANIGYFTLLMATRSKAVKVHAFEPDPTNYTLLLKNIELNDLSNVQTYNFAVGEHRTLVDLHLCEFNRGMHRIYESTWCKGEKLTVPLVRIDDFIDYADFVKIDVEGSEFGVLKGMTNLIHYSRPIIVMEFHPPGIEEYGANPTHLYNFIRDFGYSIHLCGIHGYGDIPNISVDDLIISTRNYAGRNILCIPK